MIPPEMGDTIQLRTIVTTFPHSIEERPWVAIPKPMTPPTMEWVVDTGMPNLVAMLTQRAAERSVASIPYANTIASFEYARGFTIPFATVRLTWLPTSIAPENSKMAATMIACLNVRLRAPTLVPIALATSLAPIFHAI